MIESLVFEADGERIAAQLELCDTSGTSPAVLLLPAIAGVNDYIRSVSHRLAERGYHVLTLDYYARDGAAPDVSTPEKIGAAVQGLSDPRVLNDIRAALGALSRHSRIDASRVATFGFCIGGMYSVLAACEQLPLAAAVDYYGTVRYPERPVPSHNKPHSPLARIKDLRAPLLAHFGTYDRLISLADLDDFEKALQGAAKSYEMYRYAGAPHAFDEDFRPAVFRPVAAREAWQRTLTFLDWHLRGLIHR